MAELAMTNCATERWVVRPCTPSSTKISSWPFWSAVVVSAIIGMGFALAGAWPVLPFAGIELGALWLAIHHLERHTGDYEKIIRSDDRLTVERAVGRRTEHHDFPAYWARLRLQRTPDSAASHLFIGSHGREVEIGRQLTDEQKKTLAAELRKEFNV